MRESTGRDTRHALGRVESEAERMTGLVEDLLLLARLDAEQPLSYRSGDLAPLVVDAAGDARAAGPDHVWRLELPAPDEPALVRADTARLHQVVVNLLANARTHTPRQARWSRPGCAGSRAALGAASGDSAHSTELAVLIAANLAATVLRFLLLRAWVFPDHRRGTTSAPGEEPRNA